MLRGSSSSMILGVCRVRVNVCGYTVVVVMLLLVVVCTRNEIDISVSITSR